MIPVFQPCLDHQEIQAATQALELGWLGMGSYVGEFEQALQNYLEAEDRHIVALSTGHAALHLGLLLADVGPGDEVITPSFNNAADFQAIIATGAVPVFADIDDATLTLDPAQIEPLIGPRTKAIIAMDYMCLCCDHEKISSIANAHGLRVIHDAAHSFGTRQHGKMIGSFSDLTMFSFDPVKTITTIDGGALVVNTEAEKQRLHEMRLIGMSQPATTMYQNQRAWQYDIQQLGFRYHLSNLHAKIGLAQLAKLPEIIRDRQAACQYYNATFADIAQVKIPTTNFQDTAPFLYYLRVPAEQRDAFRTHLRERGVDTGIHWQPGHHFSLFKHCRRGPLPVTEAVGNEIISLPLHARMSADTLAQVSDAVTSFFQKSSA